MKSFNGEPGEPNEIRFFTLENERRQLRKSRTILLPEQIYSTTAQRIIEDLELLAEDSKESVTLIIASVGGDAFSGLSIMRAIRKAQHKGIKVIGEVHGHAMSMAFFILQCCNERIMGKYCVLMCHGITTFTVGDMKNVEAERKLMLKFQEDFAGLIASRNTAVGSEYQESGYWHAILEDNTPQFYGSEECLKMGIVDRVDE